MSEFEVSPHLRAQFPEGFFDTLFSLDEGLGYELFHEVLNKKGIHIAIIGDSRSGKTEKGKWLDLMLSRMGETIIILDTGKAGDLEAYFWNDNPRARFNKPVTVLIPYEGPCMFEIKGVPEEILIQVIPVPAPELYFDFIRKGEINIISLRNYFRDVKKLKKYMMRIFNDFSLDARLKKFQKWTPAVLKIDEAHEAAGGQSVAKDGDSTELTLTLSNMERQLASAGIRLEPISQIYYDFPPAMRKNTHVWITGRGAFAQKADNKAIHYLEGFATRAKQKDGWIIIHGRHFYSYGSMEFPFIGSPEGVTIEYSGFADAPLQDNDEREIQYMDGGWRGTSHVPREMVILGPSISTVPETVLDMMDLPELKPFEMPESWKEKKEEMVES